MGAVVVVSGGGTGIGRATARALAADGSEVLIFGRRVDVLERTAAELGAETEQGRVGFMRVDVTSPVDVDAVAELVASTYGTIDAVVNNAGGGAGTAGPGLEGVAETWRSTYETARWVTVLRRRASDPVISMM